MARENHQHSFLVRSARAHMLMFESPLAPDYSNAVGRRILLSFLAVAIGAFSALKVAGREAGLLDTPIAKTSLVLALLVVFLVVHAAFVRAPFAAVGLRSRTSWSEGERLYLTQVAPLALIGFALVFKDHLLSLLNLHGYIGFLVFSVFTGLVWGVLQEFLYRGWLQTELTRRFGALGGLLVSNVAFTLGPLHTNLLFGSGVLNWWTIAAVFAIGLLFGIVYYRSGNLWIPAVLHGLWPLNMN
ncbi:MAG: CPBP family intramembrane metalloprotease [Betaproteobacteria bacterium]|nr:CPBP family intramembrane metalloprotease [Betaproteobacteria bacterium]